MLLKDEIEEYKQYLIVEKGLSKNTINAYIKDLNQFESLNPSQQNIRKFCFHQF